MNASTRGSRLSDDRLGPRKMWIKLRGAGNDVARCTVEQLYRLLSEPNIALTQVSAKAGQVPYVKSRAVAKLTTTA